MTDTTTLRHDDPEAALPHQIELPASWGLKLPDPLPFECILPAGVSVPNSRLVELHWWACLSTQLYAILALPGLTEKARYRVDTVHRRMLAALRDGFGISVQAAVAVATSQAKRNMPKAYTYADELGYWCMAMQASFGLFCVQTVALGWEHPSSKEAKTIYEWVCSAFEEALGDRDTFRVFQTLCTGTESGTAEEKVGQWNGSLEKAAEGLPAGVPGVEEAIAEPSDPAE